MNTPLSNQSITAAYSLYINAAIGRYRVLPTA
jgi:hypothetical protein